MNNKNGKASKQGSKFKRRTNRSKSWEDRESRDMRSDDRMDKKSTNDPAWYASDAAVMKDAASYPYSWPLGRPVPQGMGSYTRQAVIPGISLLKLAPCVGTNTSAASPVNIAAMSVYSYIRHANSGHSNYDATDLMLYLLAMCNVYSALNWAQRVYGLATMYDQRNRYLPRAILQAEGIDPDDIANNLANFRYRLNVLINKAATLAVPSSMTIFTRMAFLYQNIYIEGPTIKDQLYMYSPAGFHQFDLDANSAGYLDYVPLNLNNAGYTVIMQYLESLVQHIWEQEDFGIMSGDILKTYGDSLIKLASVPEFYPIVPIYDEMFLTQFKNARIYPMEPTSNDIVQSTLGEYLVSGPYLSASLDSAADLVEATYGMKIVSVNYDAPTPEMTMEATRLVATVEKDPGDGHWHLFSATEIPVLYLVATLDLTGNSNLIWAANTYIPCSSSSFVNNIGALSEMRHFKYHPELTCIDVDVTPATVIGNFWEVDNYTVLDKHDIDKLNEAAVLNLLNVPRITKWSK